MFELVPDGDLIDVMGLATRDESSAIAHRLASVAELYVRRSGELGDRQWWCVDACDAVAAELSAAQNISHARAVGQVQFACTLRHRLRRWPECSPLAKAIADIAGTSGIQSNAYSTSVLQTLRMSVTKLES